jgi:hypothetical protein
MINKKLYRNRLKLSGRLNRILTTKKKNWSWNRLINTGLRTLPRTT